jgi:excisionase family DNA binding protein
VNRTGSGGLRVRTLRQSGPPDLPTRLDGAEEVADFLGVSKDWVYERAAAGDLPSHRVGWFVKFNLAEVWAVVQTWPHSSGRKARPTDEAA